MLAGLLFSLTALPAAAQLPHLMPPGSAWLDVNYPKLFWTPRDGITGGGYLAFVRQLDFENADSPAPYSAAIAIDGQLSTSGSRQLVLEGRFPAFVNGWRFALTLEGQRRARDNYFGIGENTVNDESFVTSAQPRFYEARYNRMFARGEVQRTVAGGLRALAGFHAERWKIQTPTVGLSRLTLDQAANLDPRIGLATGDVSFRFGLVYDTRDDELAANRGVLIQGIYGIGNTDVSYTRSTISLQAYRMVGENLGLAVRGMAQGMGGTPRLGTYYSVDVSDRPYAALGGSMSHRALAENRFLGRDKLLFNFDARYHVVNLPRAARVSLLGFLDAGRVFQAESFTLKGLRVGGGTGAFIQVGRAGIVGTTIGYGPDGLSMDFTTKWTF